MLSIVDKLLTEAVENNNESILIDAYEKLTTTSKNIGNILPSNLLIKCAETAIKFEKLQITEWCIKEYFISTPSKDEYFCRACICQAHLFVPTTSKDEKNFELSVGYLLRAIQFAKMHKSLNYLVYNASVLFWSFSRPFMKKGYRHLLTNSLQLIISSLEEVKDTEFEWRAELLIFLLECLTETGAKEVLSVGLSAMEFTKQHSLTYAKVILDILFESKVNDHAKISEVVNDSEELKIYWKLLCLKKNSNLVFENAEIMNLFDCITSNLEYKNGNQRESLSLRSTHGLTRPQRIGLLVDLTRLCIAINHQEIGEKCIKELSRLASVGSPLQVELQILKKELKFLNIKGDVYTKSNIKLRLDAIEELQDDITSASQMSQESLVQVGCVTLWNACLPLLQNNLRHYVYKPLKMASQKLEEIDSLLVLMRSQMHFELAKCESDKLQQAAAKSHLIKASTLDVDGIYKSRIDHFKQRLDVSMMLYEQPGNSEDQAASIIEKASSINIKDPTRMHAYLKKAGSLLSPDAFNLVIEGEKALIGSATEKDSSKFLSEKIEKYKKAVMAVDGHLQRLSPGSNTKKRIYLWSDLAKIARKQGLWDIARASCIFCFLYNDKNLNDSLKVSDEEKEQDTVDVKTTTKDLKRLVAEVHFIYAECLVQLIKSEGAELLQVPLGPLNTKTGSVEKIKTCVEPIRNKSEADLEWSAYCKWLMEVSENSIQHFQLAAYIGVQLNEGWIVCNASIYIWNYTSHLISSGKFSLVTKYLKPLFFSLQAVRYSRQIIFLCDLSNVLVQGLIQSYKSSANNLEESLEEKLVVNNKKAKDAKRKSPSKVKKSGSMVVKDDMLELKEANAILEYMLQLTSQQPVPLSVRASLLKSWVLCKGLMNQPKNYLNFENDKGAEVAICHLEALILHTNKVADYSPVISVQEVIDGVKSVKWDDSLVLLEVWVKLALHSFNCSNIEIAIECCNHALNLEFTDPKPKNRKLICYSKKHQLLHYACIIKGQCYHTSKMNRWVQTQHSALQSFVDACVYAKDARCMNLAMNATKHYWNIIQPFLSSTRKRFMIQKSLKDVLDCIAFIANTMKNEEKRNIKEGVGDDCDMKLNEEESKLIAALYDILLQTYFEQEQFEECLKAIDEALKVIQLSQHLTLILKHKIGVLARLNKSFETDIARFQKPSEDFLSNVWLKVAQSSVNKLDRISAYRNSVCVLSNRNVYKKVNKLMELAGYLFSNSYPVETAIECLTHAISLLLSKNVSTSSDGFSIPIDVKNVVTSSKDLSTQIDFQKQKINVKEMTIFILLLIMIAEISTPKKNMFKECIYGALFLVNLIWKISYSNAEKSIKNGFLPGEKLSEEQKKLFHEIDVDAELFSMTIDEISIYKLPESHIQFYKADCEGLFISKDSVENPMQFFLYLEKLVDYLELVCLSHLSSYVLLLMTYIAEEILQNQILSTMVHLKCCVLYNTLEMTAACNFHFSAALNTDLMSESNQVKGQDELNLWNQNEKLPASINKAFKQYLKLPEVIIFKVDYYIKIAEHFVQLQRFSKALFFLHEAQFFATAIEYVEANTLIDYYYALIFYYQGELIRAMNLLSNQGCSPSDAWLKRVLLLVDLILKFDGMHILSEESVTRAKVILQNAEKMIRDKEDEILKSGKYEHFDYMRARLTQKLGDILYQESVDCKNQQKIDLLIQARLKYEESYTVLNQLGRKKESLKLQLLLIKLSQAIIESKKEMKKEELLETFLQAKCVIEDIKNTLKVTSFETSSSLTIHHDLFSAYLLFTSIMQLILLLASKESAQKRLVEEKKSAIDKLIDNYVALEPELSQFEQSWHDAVQEITAISVNLSHSLLVSCQNVSYQYVKALLELGKLLTYVSKVKNADSFSSFELEEEKQRNIYSPTFHISITSQSMEYMMGAIHHSLERGYIEIVNKASFHLLESIGYRDSCAALQLLALYQSSCFSLRMRKILKYFFADATRSSSALSFNLHETHQKNTDDSALDFTNEINLNNLDRHEWWHRLSIVKNHFQLFKEIPFKITYFILQHSLDHKHLYGGVFKEAGVTVKRKDSLAESFPGFLSRTETSYELLNSMVEMHAEFLAFNKEFMRKYSKEEASVAPSVSANLSEEVANTRLLLEEQQQVLFENLIAVIEAYLGGILSRLEEYLCKEKDVVIVILADNDLLEFPLEGISVFNNQNIKSVTRDFSLQMFYHRLNPRVTKDEKKVKPDVVKSTQDTKIKTKKSPVKINDQKTTGNCFKIEKEAILLDLTVLKYVINPFVDAEVGVMDPINQMIKEQKQKTSHWVGIKGSEDVKEMQMLLDASFIFHGFGRFFSLVPPSLVAPLNLTSSHVVMLFDLAQAKSNCLRQQTDAEKHLSDDLTVESHVNTSAILSLCGAATVILNQRATSLAMNHKRLKTIIGGLLSSSVTVGELLRSLHSCKKIENDVEKGPAEKPVRSCERFNTVLYGLPNFVTDL